ncbi:MAG: DUF302 domain-containing protein [Caldisphaera sp.]|jgi:uncharacterized protein (DUF302 family)|nr:MAG: hypothetical protein C0201_04795 [Caldisphaera sp.]
MLKTYKSKYNFNELKIKLESQIIKRDMNIFSRINHSENAESVGMKLNRSILFIFGNPRNGTLLIRNDMRIGLYLPLKILIWEDDNKNPFITYEPIGDVISKFNLKENKDLLIKMDNLLETIVNELAEK